MGFHHLNAWEEDNSVIVDSIYYKGEFPLRVSMEFNFPPPLLHRCRIDLSSGDISATRLSERCCEFPMVNPRLIGRLARYAWMAVAGRESGNHPLQAIMKLDVVSGEQRVWSAAPRGF